MSPNILIFSINQITESKIIIIIKNLNKAINKSLNEII